MSNAAVSGTVIEGKYRLERELGAGGMGSVWLATQLMVDRNVAVKLLHPAFIDSDDIQARFEVEAKAIGRLHHPNCITLYDFGFSDELKAFYTVIEYIDGISLDKRLGDDIPLKEACSTIRQIAMALSHAHHQGILHRDLKPENVMIAPMTDGSEMVKVLDFGIARIVKGDAAEEDESDRLTKAGEVFGTPAYMSPEQARSTRQLTPAADLYSLGVMFYELVAGGLPFFANSAFDILMMHVTRPVPPIRRPGVPEDLKQVIFKLLEKEPEKRFQSGTELIAAIDALDIPDEVPTKQLQPKASASDDVSDFEAAPTRITPPPSAPVDILPNSTPMPEPTPPSSASGQIPIAAQSTEMGLGPDHSGSFSADSGSTQIPLAAQSGSFHTGAYNQHPSHTTGPIQVGAKNRVVVASVALLLLIVAAAVIIGVVLVDNGDASADPAVPDLTTADQDPFGSDPATDEGALAAGETEVDAGTGGGPGAPDAGKTEEAPEVKDSPVAVEEPAPEPKTTKKQTSKRPKTVKRKRTRPKTEPKTEPKPEPEVEVPELDIGDDDDDDVFEVPM